MLFTNLYFDAKQMFLNFTACLLHVLASYPGFTNFSYVSEMLSSCLVLARENMDSMQLQKMQKQVGDMRDVVSPPRNPPTPVQPASPQSKTKSPRTPKNNLGEEGMKCSFVFVTVPLDVLVYNLLLRGCHF